jgi:hypothetical protein
MHSLSREVLNKTIFLLFFGTKRVIRLKGAF